MIMNMEGSEIGVVVAGEDHRRIHDFKGNQLEFTKAKVEEVREENEQLKLDLDRITKDYQTLQMKFHDMVRQKSHNNDDNNNNNISEQENDELVLLSLGRDHARKEDKSSSSSKQSLSLELHSSKLLQTCDNNKSIGFENLSNRSSANSLEDETWPPKDKRTGDRDREVSEQPPLAKKARVSVRARCDTPTMNDGCQWRKYGQKISKGNPCPRAYYRCTVAPNCPVRKQVQRCAQDMSILITTYEGTHNHPLSMSATAMASTTSAAASMLLSGSSSSAVSAANPYNPNNTPNIFLHNSSSSPTVTLDLTSSSSSSYGPFTRPAHPNHPAGPTYRPASLSFASSDPTNASWGVLNYGSSTCAANRAGFGSINYLGRLRNGNNETYQPYTLPDTIAAATTAITADPAFQSALAAALTSVIDGGGALDGGERKMKWGEAFASNNGGCATSSRYLVNKSGESQVAGGLSMFFPASLPVSGTKSTSTSPSETRDQTS